jgi:hypothetical protein
VHYLGGSEYMAENHLAQLSARIGNIQRSFLVPLVRGKWVCNKCQCFLPPQKTPHQSVGRGFALQFAIVG